MFAWFRKIYRRFFSRYVYLAGGMEHKVDGGTRWRNQLEPALLAIGYKPLNPCKKEERVLKEFGLTPTMFKNIRKSTNLYKTVLTRMKAYDLDLIRKCKFIIAYVDESVLKGGGTQAEISHAHVWGIPVYAVCVVSVSRIPGWTIAGITKRYRSFDALLKALRGKHVD